MDNTRLRERIKDITEKMVALNKSSIRNGMVTVQCDTVEQMIEQVKHWRLQESLAGVRHNDRLGEQKERFYYEDDEVQNPPLLKQARSELKKLFESMQTKDIFEIVRLGNEEVKEEQARSSLNVCYFSKNVALALVEIELIDMTHLNIVRTVKVITDEMNGQQGIINDLKNLADKYKVGRRTYENNLNVIDLLII